MKFERIYAYQETGCSMEICQWCGAVVLLGDIVERPTQRYLVTEVLNMWEVSMGGSHTLKTNIYLDTSLSKQNLLI
jgi:hypothetical protein